MLVLHRKAMATDDTADMEYAPKVLVLPLSRNEGI